MTRLAERKKRLTYIVNYMSASDSQHWVHIPRLLKEMETLGWEIDLVSERGGRGRGEVLGMPVTFLSENGRWSRLFPLVRHLLRMRARRGRLVFVRISKSAGFVSAILGRLLGWQTLFWISGTVEDFNVQKSGVRGRLQHWSMGLLMRLVDRLVTGPETMVDYYAAAYRLAKRKILLLYNDIDLESRRKQLAAAQVPPSVLLVHRLSPVRETTRYLPGLLAALERLGQSITLDIVGDGAERPALERLCVSAGANVSVRFHGAIPQRELDQFYRRARLFVMPSYREGFPRVILEAMAYGLPIVSTDAGGTRDIVGTFQQTFVVDRDDSDAFARAVERLLSAPDERDRLRAENLIAVQRFSTPAVARMYDRTLSELVGAEPAP